MQKQSHLIDELTEAEHRSVFGGTNILSDYSNKERLLSSGDANDSNIDAYLIGSDGHTMKPFITLGLYEDGGMFTTF